MTGRADLHTHSIYSDGALTPADLVRKARELGIGTLSLTDHDSISGIEQATLAGKENDVTVIPGIELSASLPTKEVHIIGYFIDTQNEEFLSAIAIFREERMKRAERIIEKLNRLNIPLRMEDVLAQAGVGAVGRPHIAKAMVVEGHADSYYQVFNKYIGDGGPASERKAEFSPERAIALIAGAGGLSFLAHPGRSITEVELLSLIKKGIDGIEVVHPSHSPALVQYYRGIVNEYFLLESGGSDFHGGLKNDEPVFGKITASSEIVEAMRRRLFTLNK